LHTLSTGKHEEPIRQPLVEEIDVAQTLELLRGEKKRKIQVEELQTQPISPVYVCQCNTPVPNTDLDLLLN
jgi:hypothetical protein